MKEGLLDEVGSRLELLRVQLEKIQTLPTMEEKYEQLEKLWAAFLPMALRLEQMMIERGLEKEWREMVKEIMVEHFPEHLRGRTGRKVRSAS
jgi:hypothetical protein